MYLISTQVVPKKYLRSTQIFIFENLFSVRTRIYKYPTGAGTGYVPGTRAKIPMHHVLCNQAKYICDPLTKANMSAAKPIFRLWLAPLQKLNATAYLLLQQSRCKLCSLLAELHGPTSMPSVFCDNLITVSLSQPNIA